MEERIHPSAPTLAPQVLADAYQHRQEFDVAVLIDGLKQNTTGDRDEVKNALGALQMLTDVEVDKNTITMWAPRVMRYGFNLTPIDTTGSS